MGKQSKLEEINKTIEISATQVSPLLKEKRAIRFKKKPVEYSVVITYDITEKDNPFYRRLLKFIDENYFWLEITKSTYNLLTKTGKRFSNEEIEALITAIQSLFENEKPLNEGFKDHVTKVVLLRGEDDRYIQTRTIIHEINGNPEPFNENWRAMKQD
ncbi:MAG TPA: hypothetical protein VIU12_30150 [Chryseolinea sp.]